MEQWRIGIDCRLWGITHAGLGRYTRELVLNIIFSMRKKRWQFKGARVKLTLFFNKKEWFEDRELLKDCEIVEIEINHYSFKEQLSYGSIIDRQNLDLVHFTHFNVPILTQTPYVVTIHDLIKHFFKGRSVTTWSLPVYWLKHLGYRFVLQKAIARAVWILVPSYFVKDQISVHYPWAESKITVTYEGVSQIFKDGALKDSDKKETFINKYRSLEHFFIYTGSLYPFKDVPCLLRAFKKLIEWEDSSELKLIVSCARDVFWERLRQEIKSLHLGKEVIFPGKIDDEDLAKLYKMARAMVMPSLMEGFGLPGLEAMAVGCPVIAANAGSMPEVYGKAAIYFNPQDVLDLAEKMKSVLHYSDTLRDEQVQKGLLQAKQYSWGKTAEETIKIYSQALRKVKKNIYN